MNIFAAYKELQKPFSYGNRGYEDGAYADFSLVIVKILFSIGFVSFSVIITHILTIVFPVYFLVFLLGLFCATLFEGLVCSLLGSELGIFLIYFTVTFVFVSLYFAANFFGVSLFLYVMPFLLSLDLHTGFYSCYCNQTKNRHLFYFYSSNLAYLLAMSMAYYVSFNFYYIHFSLLNSFFGFLFHCINYKEFNMDLFLNVLMSLSIVLIYFVFPNIILAKILLIVLLYLKNYLFNVNPYTTTPYLFSSFGSSCFFAYYAIISYTDSFFGKTMLIFELLDRMLLWFFEKDFELVKSDNYTNDKVFDDCVLMALNDAQEYIANVNTPVPIGEQNDLEHVPVV